MLSGTQRVFPLYFFSAVKYCGLQVYLSGRFAKDNVKNSITRFQLFCKILLTRDAKTAKRVIPSFAKAFEISPI